MHSHGCFQALRHCTAHSMLQRVANGVLGLPGRPPWTPRAQRPAPNRERAAASMRCDILAMSGNGGLLPVLPAIVCPAGASREPRNTQRAAPIARHIVAIISIRKRRTLPAAHAPTPTKNLPQPPVQHATAAAHAGDSRQPLCAALAPVGAAAAPPAPGRPPKVPSGRLHHRHRAGKPSLALADASNTRVTCRHTSAPAPLRLQPEQEQQTQTAQAAMHTSAPSAAAADAAAAARGRRDQDSLQLSMEARLGIPQEIYRMVRHHGACCVQGCAQNCLVVERRWLAVPCLHTQGTSCQPPALASPGALAPYPEAAPSPCVSPCWVQAGGVRVRQHVNPLKKELQVPTDPPAWGEAYAQPQRPLVLDIGCGYGRFLLALRCACGGAPGTFFFLFFPRCPIFWPGARGAFELDIRTGTRLRKQQSFRISKTFWGCRAKKKILTLFIIILIFISGCKDGAGLLM